MSQELAASLERDLEKARYKIERDGVKNGAGNEAAYGAIYQRLVRLGVRPQLRLKYRYH